MGMRIGVKLFGVFEVTLGAVPQVIAAKHWRARRARWLLQLIALQKGAQLHRDLVLEALWPDSDSEAAANRLHHTLHVLRKIFAQHGIDPAHSVVQAQGGMVQLNPGYALVIDACEFQRLVSQARSGTDSDSDTDDASQAEALAQAIALYTGDLLVNEPYEDWVAQSREGYKRDYVWALERLARVRRDSDQREAAIELYKKLVEAEPTHEGAHRALMQLFEEGGHPERAMLQYIACKRYLERDLDVLPSSETEALADAINDREKQKRARAQKDKAAAGGGDDGTAKPRYSAPAHAIALLGREQDLATLESWLAEDKVRLISIVGSAGLGKTRLVHALAERCQDAFKDGVVALALTTLSEPEQFIGQLAVALGVTAQGETELAAVSGYLASRQLLLVLDRFEHILPAAQQVSALLTAAPRLKILATTQAPLRIPAERLYDLPSLLHGAASAATALFRAVAANLNVHLDGDQYVAPIGQICERLGGNALAIELAAAQTQLYSLPEILSGLDQPLNLLNNPIHVLEQQHRSLRDAIEWSHRLLNDETKRIFAMLGVFASAFTLEDATAVLKDFCDKPALTRAIQTLIDRHLIVRSEHTTQSTAGSTLTLRFAFLDAVKHFAEVNLDATTHQDAIWKMHAAYFSERYSTLISQMRSGQLGRANSGFSYVKKESDRVLSTLQNAGEEKDYLRVSYHVALLFFLGGQHTIARSYVTKAIAAVPHLKTNQMSEGGWCHYVLARCYSFQGDHFSATKSATKALHAGNRCHDLYLSGKAILQLAVEHVQQLNLESARQQCTKMLRSSVVSNLDETNLQGQVNLLAATVENLDGNPSLALSIAIEGFEITIKAANAQMAAMLLGMQVEAQLSLGRLDSASKMLAELSVRYSMHTAPFSALTNQYLKILLALEGLDFEVAETTFALAATDMRLQSSDVFRIPSLVLRDTIAYEQGKLDSLVDGTSIDVAYLCDAEWAHIWVRHWIYFVKRASRRNDRNAVRLGIDKLVPILAKTKNGLWYSWLFDACSLALVETNEWQAADSLLDYSKQLIETAGINATHRQRRDWQRLEAAIDSTRESAAQMTVKVSNGGRTIVPSKRATEPVQWYGASAETLRLLQQFMTYYIVAGS
jgi:DNA-binding SARP family transcriptional activator/predicted ATPase